MMANINVMALMTISAGTRDKPLVYKKGESFSVDTAEADRLLRIGAVSISGEMPKMAPLPAEVQPTENSKK